MSLEAAEQAGQSAPRARARGRFGTASWTSSSALTWLVFAVLSAGAATLFLYETRGTTFGADEWLWILHRRGSSLSTFLRPHNGHFSLAPIAIYKLLFVTAGLHDYSPYRAVVTGAHLGAASLVLVYARRRVPDTLALPAAALILFLGPAWEDVLWPFQLAWLLSIAAGLGALLLLDRGDRLGDSFACLLLVCSLASSGLGVPIALGAAVDVLARANRRRRAWVVLVPLALYGLWWLVYQDTSVAGRSILLAPAFVAKLSSATMSSIVGLAGDPVPNHAGTLLTFGPMLLVLGVIAFVWRVRQAAQFSPRVMALLVVALSFWFLVALSRAQFSIGYEGRYLYLGALAIILLAVELARGVVPALRVSVLIGALAGLAILSNLEVFREGGRFLRSQSQLASADLGALEIARHSVSPSYVPSRLPGWPLVIVDAGSYFAAERALGSPAASPAQLAAEPEPAREAADAELVSMHGVRLQPAAGPTSAGRPPGVELSVAGGLRAAGACVSFKPVLFTPAPYAAELQVLMPPGGLRVVAQGGSAMIGVRRFAATFQSLGTLATSAPATIRIGPDLSTAPWHLRVVPNGTTTVCGLR